MISSCNPKDLQLARNYPIIGVTGSVNPPYSNGPGYGVTRALVCLQ